MNEKEESEKSTSNLLILRLKRNYLECHFKLLFLFTIFDKQHFTVRKQTICGNMIRVGAF